MIRADRVAAVWLGTFATNGLKLFCGIATGIVVARLLQADGRGLLAVLQFWPGLMWSIGMLSVTEAASHRIARSGPERETVAASALWVTMALALGTTIVAATLLPFLLGPERRQVWAIALLYAVTIIPLNSLMSTLRGLYQGELRFARYNIWGLISPLVHLSGLLTLWALDLVSVTNALAAFWLGTFVAAISLLSCRWRDVIGRPSWREIRRLLGVTARFHGTNLAFLLASQMDRLAVILFWGDAPIGLYTVALTWASSGLNTITMSFRTVMFPHLSAQTDGGRGRALLAGGLRYASCLLALGTLALATITWWLLPLLFGATFRDSVPVALVLLAANYPSALRQIVTQSLRGFGRARPGTISELATIVAFGLGVWPLTHAFGLLGVAIALLLANLASLGYLIYYLKCQLGLRLGDWWGLTPGTMVQMLQILTRQLRGLRHASRSATVASTMASTGDNDRPGGA